jgi:16S rRNA (guanine(527)-N(7))-methyltransferase RsmG
MTESSGSVHEDVRGEIDALAERHGLGEATADALQALVRLVDWAQPNFVPKSDPEHRRQGEKSRSAERQRSLAANMLSESLAGMELEQVREATRMADLGTGAGFPGLVLAIALPQARVALIEQRHDSCRFLRRAIVELDLGNVEVVELRAQHWSKGAGTCDLVTSRGMGRPNTIVSWSAPLLKPGGAVVLWRGQRNSAKEALAAEAAEAAGLRLAKVHPTGIRGGRLNLHVYEKANEQLAGD